MSNLHSPERQPGESQADYRERRAESRAASMLRDKRGYRVFPGKQSSREQQRDTKRANGTLRGTYGLRIVQVQQRANQHAMVVTHPLRDEDGAYTLVGRLHNSTKAFVAGGPLFTRRKWLAGISARRGY